MLSESFQTLSLNLSLVNHAEPRYHKRDQSTYNKKKFWKLWLIGKRWRRIEDFALYWWLILYLRNDELFNLTPQNFVEQLNWSNQTSLTIIRSKFNEEIEILKWGDTKNDRW